MFCFFTVPILIMSLLLHILPSFHNYKRINSTRTGKNCSSGRSGRKGRHGDRHHTWWGSLNNRKRKSSIINHQHQSTRHNINALQYFDCLPIPANMAISNDNIYYDSKETYHILSWLPPEPDSKPALTTTTINMMVDSIDVLDHYKQLQFFDSVSFFNSRYRRLDPLSSQHSTILLHTRYLKSQVFHYDSTFNNDDDSTTSNYVSTRDTELPIVIDTGASNSITPIPSDFVNGIIRKATYNLSIKSMEQHLSVDKGKLIGT
jgi:hypothetical protein